MISNTDIANALGQRLLTLTPVLPVAWPNKDLPAGTSHPWLIFDHVPVSRTEGTIRGGHAISRGFAQMTVMEAQGSFATSATNIAEDIAALFPFGLRLAVTGGKVLINQPPEVQQGYPDGPHWRVPVMIRYEARA